MGDYKEFHNPYLLVKPNDALKLIKNNNYKVIDIRPDDEYLNEHIQDALQITREDIESDDYPYVGMRADKVQIENLFSKLGVSNNDNLLLIDGRAGYDAARLWWLLKIYGYEKVQVIDGGIDGWNYYGLPIVSGELSISPKPTNFSFSSATDNSLLADKDDVIRALKENNTIILDTREEDEFIGDEIKEGAFIGGRIPQSVHINYVEAVDVDGDYGIKNRNELEVLYGDFKENAVIAYCHTGVRSAFTTMILSELLGYENIKNYDGSWVEWSHFEDLPILKDNTSVEIEKN